MKKIFLIEKKNQKIFLKGNQKKKFKFFFDCPLKKFLFIFFLIKKIWLEILNFFLIEKKINKKN